MNVSATRNIKNLEEYVSLPYNTSSKTGTFENAK